MLAEPLQCGCTVWPQLAAAVTFFDIAAVPSIVLDVLAAVEPVQAFAAARGRAIPAGVNLATAECAFGLGNARLQIPGATLPSYGVVILMRPSYGGRQVNPYIFYT